MDITGKLRKAVCSQDLTENKIFTVLEAADEIEKLREALLHIAWGGIQSVDDAEKYARKILEENV